MIEPRSAFSSIGTLGIRRPQRAAVCAAPRPYTQQLTQRKKFKSRQSGLRQQEQRRDHDAPQLRARSADTMTESTRTTVVSCNKLQDFLVTDYFSKTIADLHTFVGIRSSAGTPDQTLEQQ